jgi:hypothetical protein
VSLGRTDELVASGGQQSAARSRLCAAACCQPSTTLLRPVVNTDIFAINNRDRAASVSQQYPWLEENGVLDVLIPKKEPMFVAKW